MIATFKTAEGDLNLTTFDGADERAIIGSLETLPFLGTRRLTIVRDFDFKKKCDALTTFVKDIPTHASLMIETAKADARTSLFKAIAKHGEVQTFDPPKPAEFSGWLTREATTRGLTLARDAAELLAVYTSGDCEAAIRELEKLAAYIDGTTITRSDVEAIVHPDVHASVFALTDAISARRVETAIGIIHDLTQRGENLVQIFFMIVRQIRILLSIRALLAQKTPSASIASELKLHPFVVKQALAQAGNFSEDELRHAMSRLLAIDVDIKTGRIVVSTTHHTELALALESFVITIAKG